MPVVAVAAPAGWPATVVDAGATPWDATLRLAPWSTYTWRAEVQGAPEPGSALAGRVVPSPPGTVNPGAAASTAAGVEVSFTSPSPLDGGPEGTYTIDVFRRTPVGSELKSGSVGPFAAGATRQPDGSYLVRESAAIPPGTVYLVEVADPLGRRGPRVEVATLA